MSFFVGAGLPGFDALSLEEDEPVRFLVALPFVLCWNCTFLAMAREGAGSALSRGGHYVQRDLVVLAKLGNQYGASTWKSDFCRMEVATKNTDAGRLLVVLVQRRMTQSFAIFFQRVDTQAREKHSIVFRRQAQTSCRWYDVGLRQGKSCAFNLLG